MNEEELKQLFENRSDCYADTNEFNSQGVFVMEGEVVQAMTKDRFIEVLKELGIIKTK